jgi:HD-GYP domain-containing protein (c-di-GMP phosphodiesterase class II)
MARMADIMRKVRQQSADREEPESGSAAIGAEPFSGESSVRRLDSGFLRTLRSKKDQSSERTEDSVVQSDPACDYHFLLNLTRGLFSSDKTITDVDVSEIRRVVAAAADVMAAGDVTLFSAAFSAQAVGIEFICAHSVLVFLYAMSMGRGAGFSRLQLEELGLAALLHDIGMNRLTDLVVKADEFTDAELVRLRQHPLLGADMLSLWPGLPESVPVAVRQHHEYADGSGYPQGLSRHAINEYARITGLADAYAFLIRPRFPAVPVDPVTAIKKIIEDKKRFPPRLVKLVVERVGVFPVGSTVVLNTGERAVVTRLNYENPLRPEVRISADAAGEQVLQPKVLDLLRHPTIFIRECTLFGMRTHS